MKVMSIFWEKYIYWLYRYKCLKLFKILTPVSIHMRRRVCHAWKVPWNSLTVMSLRNVIICFWMFSTDSQSFPFSFLSSVGKPIKNRTGPSRHCKRTGGPPGCCCGPVGSDKSRVIEGIIMVEPNRVFDVSPYARDPAFQSLQRLQVKGWVDSCFLEHPEFVFGYDKVEKVRLILNQIQQFSTSWNSKFLLIFRPHFQ